MTEEDVYAILTDVFRNHFGSCPIADVGRKAARPGKRGMDARIMSEARTGAPLANIGVKVGMTASGVHKAMVRLGVHREWLKTSPNAGGRLDGDCRTGTLRTM